MAQIAFWRATRREDKAAFMVNGRPRNRRGRNTYIAIGEPRILIRKIKIKIKKSFNQS